MYNREAEIDMEAVASFLQDAVYRVKNQENPDLLNDIKKVFKKNVPFSLRMYVAAYLVKEMQKNYRGGYRSQRRDFRDPKQKFSRERPMRERKPMGEEYNSVQEERQPRPRIQIDPAVAATIFISIGRNRRVFPRDLVGLLVSVAGIDRDRIGDIRVLANYSFIQLFAEDSEKAISALNGYDYRGRKLAVSYSRQREEGAEESAAAEPSYVEQDGSAPFEQQSAEDAAAYAAAEKAAANKEPFTAPHISAAEVPADDAAPSSNDGSYLV
ncbi:MAG: DbpA RNA binding domain-containing protein [Treponemataceae bacterium]|nr:DbpA RNA binding domain-containing protein [Treponemataceae bacterium]